MRLPDWPMRLSNYLSERAKMPFSWGDNDCLSFTAKAVEELTGVDFYKDYSDYHDEESAAIMLKNNGGAKGIITACLGEGKRSILSAKRGDVVVVKIPDYTAGIVDDTGQRIALVTPKGLMRIPLKRAIMYWSY